ncbi:hypothetical protein CHUAL_005974 [Chamberlinius hualienensis]
MPCGRHTKGSLKRQGALKKSDVTKIVDRIYKEEDRKQKTVKVGDLLYVPTGEQKAAYEAEYRLGTAALQRMQRKR